MVSTASTVTIATGWAPTRLRDVLIQNDRSERLNGTMLYRLLGVRLAGQGPFLREEKLGQQIQASRLFKVHAGDFIYSRLFAWRGAFGVIPEELHGAYVSSEFPTFSVDHRRVDVDFLRLYFSRPRVWSDVETYCAGTTKASRNRFKEEFFLAMEIPLPEIDEQRRIVSRIEELAAKVEEARSLRRQTTEESERLFSSQRAAVFGALRGNGTDRFDTAATLERGKFSHRPRNEPRFFGGSHPWIQIGEIEGSTKYIREWTNTLNDDGLAISRKFPKGTVLVSIAATIGAVGILDFDCCIPDSIVAVTPKPGVENEFIYHYLGYVRGHLEDVAPQSAQKNINLRILAGLPFSRVALDEQNRIIAYLNNLQARIDALRKIQSETAAELDALMPSILDKAFRGEL